MLEMFYSTGMRRTELLRLRLYDVDREAGIVTIREGKGKKDRVIPIGERAVAWLDKYLDQARPQLVAEPDDGTLFLTVQGEPFGPNRLSGLVRDYVEAAGIGKHGACHLFRHTMATLMLEGGADIRFIQQMLGHARLDTTQIYTHVSIRMLKQIHSATHPAAQLKRGSEAPEEAVETPCLPRLFQARCGPEFRPRQPRNCSPLWTPNQTRKSRSNVLLLVAAISC